MYRPMRSQRAVIQPETGPQRLRNGELRVLHPPGAKVLRQDGGPPGGAELALDSGIRVGAEVLANQRPEENVSGLISGDEGCLSPRPAHLELDRARSIARVHS